MSIVKSNRTVCNAMKNMTANRIFCQVKLKYFPKLPQEENSELRPFIQAME